jgi:hypothetical protein
MKRGMKVMGMFWLGMAFDALSDGSQEQKLGSDGKGRGMPEADTRCQT